MATVISGMGSGLEGDSHRARPGGAPKARSPLHQVSLKTAPDLTSRATIRSPRKKLLVTEALIGDESGAIKAVWFNQRFLEQTLKKGETVMISGKIERSGLSLQFISPEYERFKQDALQSLFVNPNDSVGYSMSKMSRVGAGLLLVVDERKRLLGVITERIINKIAITGRKNNIIFVIIFCKQKRSSVGGSPFEPPISLSRYDYEHSTDQKTVYVFIDFRPCHAKARFRSIQL
jgi:hypothetical protein